MKVSEIKKEMFATPVRVVFHWTGGPYTATFDDLVAYHFVIECDGNIEKGRHSIADNNITYDGKYAAHVRGLNTGSIGVAIACMYDAQPGNIGKYPPTWAQWDIMCAVGARMNKLYDIPVTEMVTHAEVEKKYGVKQRGKWDITVAPGSQIMHPANDLGARIRDKIARILTESPTSTFTLPEVNIAVDGEMIIRVNGQRIEV